MIKIKTLKLGVVFLNLLLLISCGGNSIFSDHSCKYTDAVSCPPLVLPCEIQPESFCDDFRIP